MTLTSPGEAAASSTDDAPDTLDPPAGTSTVVLGTGLSTVTPTAVLASVFPSASVATATRVSLPLATVVVFHGAIQP